jgi:hypothetical protein
MRFLAIFALAALAAASPDGKNRLKPDHAPTPFSAAEIRAGCPEGRMTTFVVEQPGQPPSRQVTRFTRGDAEGTDYEIGTIGPDGAVGAPRVTHATWKKLQEHASYPDAATKITDETITVPAGEFDCWLYTVTTGNAVRKFWFAKELPGPPVKVVATAGNRTFIMALESNRPFDFAFWLGPQEFKAPAVEADATIGLKIEKGSAIGQLGGVTTLFHGKVTTGVVRQLDADGVYVVAEPAAKVEGAVRVTKGPLKGALIHVRGEKAVYALPRGTSLPTGPLEFEVVALKKSD